MKSTSSTGSNEIKSVIIKPPLILQFIAAFSNDKNIIPVPAFYHTQWAPQYLEFVHLRYNGAIYKIQLYLLGVHIALMQQQPNTMTIIVPQHPQQGREIAKVIGGSLLPGWSGHNISEAAAAGCAVLTGFPVGHFSHMVLEMQRSNPLSVLQVSGKLELEHALIELFTNATLQACGRAAKEAFCWLSSCGVVENIWSLLNFHIFVCRGIQESKTMRNEV
ncbi:putative 3-deoxy-D-manno-octulosonic acid transferase, mitochondrial [Glycine soja]|uniref:Putative 3-deoxy-D-manno-octulosonic acid transferase, mitochondrial n=1 Tax=Glycine soja TaxID=3848 RepID=A0A445HG02_GLYSO|nr:putative 3-deoxy-D-manno-octulosonic acid transferase, mitochondrial [Glycine soja]